MIKNLKIALIKKSIILSEEYKFWKFISGKKYLNENLINYDKKLLNNFYKNKGFYNIEIESSFANYLGNDEFEVIIIYHLVKNIILMNLILIFLLIMRE